MRDAEDTFLGADQTRKGAGAQKLRSSEVTVSSHQAPVLPQSRVP